MQSVDGSQYGDNDISLNSALQHGFEVVGRGNIVHVGANSALSMRLVIHGDRNRVRIEERCTFNGVFVGFVNVNDAELYIGEQTTMGGDCSVHFHETAKIHIGRDCMFSKHVFITVSDMHPIFEIATGQRINKAESVFVGNHVWIGYRSIINKGTDIGDGSIIGAASLVSSSVPENSLAAGSPARVIRSGVEWRRSLRDGPSAG